MYRRMYGVHNYGSTSVLSSRTHRIILTDKSVHKAQLHTHMVHGPGPTTGIQSPRVRVSDNRPTISPVEAVLASILDLEG